MSDLEQLRRLAGLMIHGTASRADAATLSAILKDDPELQDAYLAYLDTHAALCWMFREQADGAVSDSASPVATKGPSRWIHAALLPWIVATVATVVAVIAFSRSVDPLVGRQVKVERQGEGVVESRVPHNSTDTARPPTVLAKAVNPPLTALLVDQVGARFAEGRGPDGVRFGVGDYGLREGIVHLRFSNGADVVVPAPADFRIEDAFHVRMNVGRMRAIVPPTAHGFTIATQEVDFEDIGTEFAVSVDAAGESALHVFDGQVDVRRSGATELLRSVMEGEWMRFHNGRMGQGPDLDLSRFLTPEHIGFLRWKSHRKQRIDSPGLIAWFPFTRGASASLLTNVQRRHGVPDGRVVGARWVSGRWPGKQALLFDRDTDYVQLELPGEFDELSIAVWLKADRFDRELHAILNSNQGDAGDVHFQLTRYGLPRGGLLGPENEAYRWVGHPVPLAKWTHIVSVISLSKRQSFIYVNGKIVTEIRLPNLGKMRIRPGFCRLGNWLPSAKFRKMPLRAFRGRIDELAVWNRALGKDEIVNLVERGRPSLVWSRENPPLGMPMPTP